jgi:hypothetical protein
LDAHLANRCRKQIRFGAKIPLYQTADPSNINEVNRTLPLHIRGVAMRELTADLFISLDGFASGVDQPPYFGYFGPDLESWVREHLARPQLIIMGRVTYESLA